MSIEAMKLWLKALETSWYHVGTFCPTDAAIELYDAARDSLRQAIEQAQKQEPVAFYVYKPTLPRGNLGNVSDGDLPWVYDQDPSSGYSARMLVYTSPPPRQPLTDEQIIQIAFTPDGLQATTKGYVIPFARAIEAAHGIKGKA